jgi:hypothetical protein
MALCGWLRHEQNHIIAFLREENRVLKARLEGQRLRLADSERRRLAELGHRLGRRVLGQVATIVTPDTILRWHRQFVACKWDVCARPCGPSPTAGAPSRVGDSDGDGQSDLGLHADSRCPEKRRPSCGSFINRTHPPRTRVVPENSADDSPDICGGKDELLPWNRRLHSWKERKDFSPTSVHERPNTTETGEH